jgi:hypothetical protein
MQSKKTGRGWHGNSKAHAEAGRKGGLVSRRTLKDESPQKVRSKNIPH